MPSSARPTHRFGVPQSSEAAAAGRLARETRTTHIATSPASQHQAATRRAIEVPLAVMRACAKLLPLVERVAAKGNKNSISDAGVAAMALKTAAGGAYLNVLTNLSGLADKKYAGGALEEARKLMDGVAVAAPRISESIEKGLGI